MLVSLIGFHLIHVANGKSVRIDANNTECVDAHDPPSHIENLVSENPNPISHSQAANVEDDGYCNLLAEQDVQKTVCIDPINGPELAIDRDLSFGFDNVSLPDAAGMKVSGIVSSSLRGVDVALPEAISKKINSDLDVQEFVPETPIDADICSSKVDQELGT